MTELLKRNVRILKFLLGPVHINAFSKIPAFGVSKTDKRSASTLDFFGLFCYLGACPRETTGECLLV